MLQLAALSGHMCSPKLDVRAQMAVPREQKAQCSPRTEGVFHKNFDHPKLKERKARHVLSPLLSHRVGLLECVEVVYKKGSLKHQAIYDLCYLQRRMKEFTSPDA